MSNLEKANSVAHEQWLPVPGYEGLYEVSDFGRVRRLPAVVIATGAQVRAAREAMEQENE